jgi:hypothetical protein
VIWAGDRGAVVPVDGQRGSAAAEDARMCFDFVGGEVMVFAIDDRIPVDCPTLRWVYSGGGTPGGTSARSLLVLMLAVTSCITRD